MTRLDQHVNIVRTRLALGTFLTALAWALAAFAAVVWVAVLVDRFLVWRLPRWGIWFWAGLGVSVAAAAAYAVYRRPSRQRAAVAIDDTLGLKEKFSTALYVRPMSDPFAAAAVRDAEMTADNVSLHKRFPVRTPLAFVGTAAVAAVAALTAIFLGSHPLFPGNPPAEAAKTPAEKASLADTRKMLDNAIAKIESTPKTEANKETIEAAKREIMAHREAPNLNEPAARQSAMKAIQNMEEIKQKVKDAQKYAKAQNEMKEFTKGLGQTPNDKSLVGKIQNEIAQGKFQDAVNDLGEVVKKFDQMKKEDQQQAAQDMQKLANQLQNMAQNPAQQQQIQNQLKQMGASQQQMQQLANLAQAAAAGDKQAQQQVQQMANQIAQNINNNPNLTPQQQQQIAQQVQGLVNQMQGAANNQQAAQQMAQAAQQMAQAMQQQAGGGQPQQGGQAGKGQQQQANAGQGQQGGQQAGQQGQQGQGQQGQGQGQGQGQQAMAGGAQQMQQQLQQMQQAADDAAAIAQGQQGAGQGGNGNGNGPDGQGQMAGQPNNNLGPFAQGNPNGQAGGAGGPGVAAGGGRPRPLEAPSGFKQEQAPSQTIDSGKIIASSFVKALSDKGKSNVGLSDVVQAAEKEATDEVEQDRISKPAQKVVKQYFDDLKRGTEEGK